MPEESPRYGPPKGAPRSVPTPNADLKRSAEELAAEIDLMVDRAASSLAETLDADQGVVAIALTDLVSREVRERAGVRFADTVTGGQPVAALAKALSALLGITPMGVRRGLGGARSASDKRTSAE